MPNLLYTCTGSLLTRTCGEGSFRVTVRVTSICVSLCVSRAPPQHKLVTRNPGDLSGGVGKKGRLADHLLPHPTYLNLGLRVYFLWCGL